MNYKLVFDIPRPQRQYLTQRQMQTDKQKALTVSDQAGIQLNPSTRALLSWQYKIVFPQKVQNFRQVIEIAEKGLKQSILKLKYGLNNEHMLLYGIKAEGFQLDQCPFPQEQMKSILELCQLCQTILRKRDYGVTTFSLNRINSLLHGQCQHISLRDQKAQQMQRIQSLPYPKLIAQEQRTFHQEQVKLYQDQQSSLPYIKSNLKVHLQENFKLFTLNFRYLNFKEAILFESLSRCQIWFTICRQRRKSGKGFFLDPLINTFDSIVKKAQLTQAPFHISVLPRKNVRGLEKKQNIEKSKNSLFDAVANRRHNQAKQLILNGADIQAPGFGNQRIARQMRCSHKAAQKNDLEMCKILTSFGVNWEAQDNEKMTPIFYTIQGRSFQVLKYLIEQIKVDIEKREIQDRTPFYWASTEGELPYIRYLYEHGANINHRSKLGRCPLSKACFLGRRDIVQFLLDCNQMDFSSKDSKGRTALHNTTFGSKGGRQGQKFGTNASDSPDCAQLILQKGLYVDQPDFQKNTALHIANSSQALDSIRLLMAWGASMSARNDYGQTPIMTAAKFGHIESVKLLYEQYHSSITDKDVFEKNMILLVTKFRVYKDNTAKHYPQDGTNKQKNTFIKLNSQLNPVFPYIADKFIYQCYVKYLSKQHQGKQFEEIKKQHLEELYQTFREMLKHSVHQQFMFFTQKLIENGVPFPKMALKDVKMLLQMQELFQGEEQKKVVLDILHSKNQQGLHVFQLQKQAIQEFMTWLIRKNNISLLQFVSQNEVLVFYHFNKKSHGEFQSNYELPMKILASSIHCLKEKVITFCLFNLPFNWIDFVDQTTGQNILHLLVRSRKVGSIIQITKVLGGKKIPFLKNKYLCQLLQKQELKQQTLREQFQFKLSPINQIFIQLLSHQDNNGTNPYQLAHIVKQTSIIKIFSERLKQSTQASGITGDSMEKWDVKEYKIQKQTQDQQQLKIFDAGYQLQKQLQDFISDIQQCKDKQQLSKYMKILTENTQQLSPTINIQKDIQNQWQNFKKRPLILIKTQQQIQLMKKLLNGPKIIGIDLEYDFTENNETIICTMQLSSIQEDYIIDMMSCTFQNGQNRYIPFIGKLKNEIFQPLCYDKTITKLMHGSDHDLYILKSCFNCSFINFLDSSRIDIDLKKSNRIRGLSTLVKEYLHLPMSKDHQVSEWRMRPIPQAMLEYARKDSMILPFLVHRMLSEFKTIQQLKDTIINGFKHGKKNKKPNLSLIKNLIPI